MALPHTTRAAQGQDQAPVQALGQDRAQAQARSPPARLAQVSHRVVRCHQVRHPLRARLNLIARVKVIAKAKANLCNRVAAEETLISLNKA